MVGKHLSNLKHIAQVRHYDLIVGYVYKGKRVEVILPALNGGHKTLTKLKTVLSYASKPETIVRQRYLFSTSSNPIPSSLMNGCLDLTQITQSVVNGSKDVTWAVIKDVPILTYITDSKWYIENIGEDYLNDVKAYMEAHKAFRESKLWMLDVGRANQKYIERGNLYGWVEHCDTHCKLATLMCNSRKKVQSYPEGWDICKCIVNMVNRGIMTI